MPDELLRPSERFFTKIFNFMNRSVWRGVYGITGFIGILSAIWGHEIYLSTFVGPAWLFLICLIPTIVFFLLIRAHYKRQHDTASNYWPFLYSLFSVGLLTTSLFLVVNYKLASTEVVTMTVDIQKSGELAGRGRKPYAIIKYSDFTKRLVFKRNPTITSTSQIKLSTSKGLFGLEVISNQEIIN